MGEAWEARQAGRGSICQYLSQYLLLDLLEGLWSDDRHPADQFGQRQIRRTAAVEKIERVLRFSRESLNRKADQAEKLG